MPAGGGPRVDKPDWELACPSPLMAHAFSKANPTRGCDDWAGLAELERQGAYAPAADSLTLLFRVWTDA